MTLQELIAVAAIALAAASDCDSPRVLNVTNDARPVAEHQGAQSAAPPMVTHSGTKLTYFGQSAFKLETPSGKVLLIDPWLTNPMNPEGKKDLASLHQVDLILITHGHFDHVGDAVQIAKRTGAKLVATFDLGRSLVQQGGFPAQPQMGLPTQGNVGGELSLLAGEVKVEFTQAIHSSSVIGTTGSLREDGPLGFGGSPSGFLITVKNGPTIYHTGDTALFGDMALIGKRHPVTVMLVCIGDHMTMGPDEAAEAVRLVGPALAVPMHYGTMPIYTGTAEQFLSAARAKVSSSAKVVALGVHQVLEL